MLTADTGSGYSIVHLHTVLLFPTDARLHTHTHTHTHAHTHTHTLSVTRPLSFTHAHAHTHTHALCHSSALFHTRTRTRTHTHTHTHTHTQSFQWQILVTNRTCASLGYSENVMLCATHHTRIHVQLLSRVTSAASLELVSNKEQGGRT